MNTEKAREFAEQKAKILKKLASDELRAIADDLDGTPDGQFEPKAYVKRMRALYGANRAVVVSISVVSILAFESLRVFGPMLWRLVFA